MYLYNGNEGSYLFPIHSEDNILSGFTYQYIMDIAGVNYGYPLMEEKIKKTIKSELEMKAREMWENFNLCKGKMIGG